MHHLTYVQAVFTGIVQGVTELFPISSLGHNVLIPALIGGSWAQNLNVSAPGSPYLAFVVGLHVATALAMIIYFRQDWVRIVKAFVSSIRNRRISTTDERLAWMIVLATIPVGIVGAALQKVFTHVFAKPTLTAFFLAVNGLILLYSERQRRVRGGAPVPAEAGGYSTGGYYYEGDGYRPSAGYGAPGGGYGPQGGGGAQGGGGPGHGGSDYGGGGYSQQPQQQQWQGPYEGQEPPRPSFTPHSQPPAGGAPGREPRGRDAGEGDWTEWFSREDEARRGRPDPGYGGQDRYDRGPGYDRGAGYEAASGYDRGRGYEGAAPQDPTAAYDRAAGFERSAAYDRSAGYEQSAGYERSSGYERSAGYDPRYGGNPARPAGYDERRAEAAEESGVAADERLSRMSWGQSIYVGAAQILALLPGISRDGIVTVAGMGKGLKREDAVRFSFLLSAPVILAAGVLKAPDLFGPEGKGIHGPVIVGSIFAGVGAYFSVRFLTKYFSESRSLKPFGLYCLIFGVLSMAYLMVK